MNRRMNPFDPVLNWISFTAINCLLFRHSVVKLQVDELDGNFYAVSRLPNVTLKSGPVDIVIAKDATGSELIVDNCPVSNHGDVKTQ